MLLPKHSNHGASEVVVHHLIESIEFCLGTVSNTASYLRLWALSLAHSQLAGVFFDKLILPYQGNPLFLVFTFPIFMSATIGVLLCMDALECFLHSLRLHWVEFQSKFYQGGGYKFERFGIE